MDDDIDIKMRNNITHQRKCWNALSVLYIVKRYAGLWKESFTVSVI